jgi:hypothetical protein
MALHGDKDLDEEWVMEKLLRAVPKKYPSSRSPSRLFSTSRTSPSRRRPGD